MKTGQDRRGHLRHSVELPFRVLPNLSETAEALPCWSVDVSPTGVLLQSEKDTPWAAFPESCQAQLWLAPPSAALDSKHSLGIARILRSDTFDHSVRLAVEFKGTEHQALAVPEFVGSSRMVQRARAQLLQAAGCNFNVLITGETGTGKTLAAECIHKLSHRRDHPFVRVNCPNLSASLFESELFGHEKGAFTDAKSATPGFFRIAGEGTLLLDEISELDLSLQAKLLRVLDEGRFVSAGGHQPVEVRCRVIAASNADLPARMKAGQFRQDLYYRLCEVPIELAPLRDSREDIPLLMEFLMKQRSKEFFLKPPAPLDTHIIDCLLQHSWPGNVRELNNCVKQWLLGRPIGSGSEARQEPHGARALDPDSLLVELAECMGRSVGNLEQFKREIVELTERRSIHAALLATGGNRARAAAMLGISYRTLARKLAEMKLEPPA